MMKTRGSSNDNDNVTIPLKKLDELIQKSVREATKHVYTEISVLKHEIVQLKSVIQDLTIGVSKNISNVTVNKVLKDNLTLNVSDKNTDSLSVCRSSPDETTTVPIKNKVQQKHKQTPNDVPKTATLDNNTNTNNHDEWKVVTKAKHKPRPTQQKKGSIIIGTSENDASQLKAIPKKAYLYVTRLMKNTEATVLQKYLKTEFPEVECTKLENNFDSNYERFKVTINYSNLEKSHNAHIWPVGAHVSRFFHPRRKINCTT